MSLITLAILSPNSNAYSETFIHAHEETPNINAIVYTGGFLPKQLKKSGKLEPVNTLHQITLRFYYLLSKPGCTFPEWLLLRSFKKENIQVVLAEYGPTPCSVLQVCKIAKLPLIVHFHGFDASKKDVIHKNKSGYLAVFAYASAVFVVSTLMKSTLVQLGCPPEKIILNPYGPNPAFFQIQPTFQQKLFVTVGRFVDKKAPYYVILAFNEVLKRHPDARLVMIGDGPLLGTCKNIVRFFHLENSISFPGVLSREDIFPYFSNAIGFVQHSVTAESGDMEGTPLGILEAAASSLPVISTSHAGIPEVVIHNKTGFLCQEHDVAQMTHYMQHLLENLDLAQDFGKKGREQVMNLFSLEKHLTNLSEAIRNAYK